MLSSAEPYDDVPEDPEELRHAEESAGPARAGHKIVVWVLVALIVLGMTPRFRHLMAGRGLADVTLGSV